jgi:predicted oxidoreductase
MKTVALGSSDLQVARICFGGMRLSPTWDFEKVDAAAIERGIAILESAVEAGYTFIDHADIYGGTACEMIHGRAMEKHPEWRDQLVVATKCGIRWPDEPKGAPHRYDFDGRHIIQSAEDSLRRLKIDRIDLYQLHRPDWLADPSDVAAAFTKLRNAGKVRFFGVSNFRPSLVRALQAALPFPLVANQVEIHFLRLATFEDGTLDQCLEMKMTPLAWSPLAGGRLGPALDENRAPELKDHEAQAATFRLRPVLRDVAKQYGVSPLAILLAWQMRHPSGIIPILGSTRPDALRDAALADTITLDRENWYRILLAAQGKPLP